MRKKIFCIVLLVLVGVFTVACSRSDGVSGRWEWESGSNALPSLVELNNGAPDWVWNTDGDRLTLVGDVFIFSVDGDSLTLEDTEGNIATYRRTR